MASSPYVFRKEGDSENPNLARLYGKGITAGLPLIVKQNHTGARAGGISILCEGARFANDTDVSGNLEVTFRGFTVPELENGVRNWRFHSGKMTKIPVYATLSAIDHGANTLTFLDPHNIIPADSASADISYKIIAEGPKSTNPAVPAGLTDEKLKYYVRDFANLGGNLKRIKLASAFGGDAIDITSDGAGVIRLYRANAGFDDPDQGRPEFFPHLDFTLSGIAYVEWILPTRFTDVDDTASDLRFILNGKKLRTFTYDGATEIITLSDAADAIDSISPALEALDIAVIDGKVPLTFEHLGVTVPRLRGSHFEAYQERCDELIEWENGGTVSGVMEFVTNIADVWAINPENGGLLKAAPAAAAAYGAVIDDAEQDFSIEVAVIAGAVAIGFNLNNTDAVPTSALLIIAAVDGKIYKRVGGVFTQVGVWATGDTLRLASESRSLVLYLNDVQVNIGAHLLPASDVYAYVHGSATTAAHVASTSFAPLSLGGTAREIKRFTSNMVFPTPTSIADALSGVFQRTPGCDWQDVNGAVKILTLPARPTTFALKHDPSQTVVQSNIAEAGVSITPIAPEDRNNFWRATIRDSDSRVLREAPIFIDRPLLRAEVGGLIDSGLLQFGVMNQSEASRILSTRAKLNSDLKILADIQSFLDSYAAAVGDFVTVADDVPGYTLAEPVKFMIEEETLRSAAVPVHDLSVRVIVDNFYDDEDQSVAVPTIPPLPNDYLRPAPIIEFLNDFGQSTQLLPGGEWVYSIVGLVVFHPFAGQIARVWERRPLGELRRMDYDETTNSFTSIAHGLVNQDEIYLIDGTDELPIALDELGTPYYVSVLDLDTFQISLTPGGAVIPALLTPFSARFHKMTPWYRTNVVVIPDENNEGAFELAPAALGVHALKIVTENRFGISFPFNAHELFHLEVIAEMVVPLPPSNVRALFDGINITFQFDPSPSTYVIGYQVTDERGRIVRNFLGTLEWTETLTRESTTRRVYAVSNLGIRSTAYAEIVFVRPPILQFRNVTGALIDQDGALVKTAATGWNNCGAILNQVLLTDKVPVSIIYAIDTADQYKVFGLTREANCDSFADFAFALYFYDNGFMAALWDDFGPQQVGIGPYSIGEKFEIQIIPNPTIGESSAIRINRLVETPFGTIKRVQLHQFQEHPRNFPSYIGVSLYTQSSQIAPHFQVGGDLIPYEGTIPEVQNVIHGVGDSILYDEATGDFEWLIDLDHAGASTEEAIPAGQDGCFQFTHSHLASFGVGLNPGDLDADFASIPFALRCNEVAEVIIYSYGVVLDILAAPATAGDVWTISRENGIFCIRRNGVLQYTYANSLDHIAEALVLDFNFFDSGEIFGLRYFKAVKTTIIAGGNHVPPVGTIEDPILGRNKLTLIPEFEPNLIPNAQPGEYLHFDENLRVVSSDLALGLEATFVALLDTILIDEDTGIILIDEDTGTIIRAED